MYIYIYIYLSKEIDIEIEWSVSGLCRAMRCDAFVEDPAVRLLVGAWDAGPGHGRDFTPSSTTKRRTKRNVVEIYT